LEPFDQISPIPAGELGELLEWPLGSPKPGPGEPFTRSGKIEEPLLIDILARRAVAIFTNSETRIAEPAWRFKIDDRKFFNVYEEFTERQLIHRDSLSWEFQALRTWQRWEHAHLNDDHPIMLTDVMLSRLQFVKDHCILPEKDSLYHDALNAMLRRVDQLPAWSEVTLAIARWHAERGERYQRLATDEYKWDKRTAVELCDSAIARFPGSFGARNAAALKARLTLSSIDLQMEDAVISDQPFKIALGYTNTPKVWLRIVADQADVQDEQRWGNEKLQWLLQQSRIREWSVELPLDGDLHGHLAELPIEALPHGRYAILVSDQETMHSSNDRIAFASFWSTRISVAERTQLGSSELLVLDRVNGKALNEAKVELFIRDNQGGDRNFAKYGSTNFTLSEGRTNIDLKKRSLNMRWRITMPDGDKYITSPNWNWYHEEGQRTDTIRTFLFTDRAIYRPGQEIHFKGILTAARKGTTEVKAGHSTIVKLFDANGELVDSLSVKSDAFGSFHGQFKAPSGLTGHMRIEVPFGSVGFQVEEYKRPTFEVTFDPITTTARLNDQAVISGIARSYAGVPLNDAEVKWVVRRMARMPWWGHDLWKGFPGWGRPTEIASGTDTTNAEGRYSIEFLAAADKELPRKADPIFIYTVEATVTDITGETQTNNTSLSLGYKSIEIELEDADAIDRSRMDSISIKVSNLNGEPVDRPVDIRIHRLKAPT
ncbi:MAG: MG2 domain-containing protein, partial [Bacteroidota bacterium]|nr:MG2 domain-containing protein [Bacteroidota bacterium]